MARRWAEAHPAPLEFQGGYRTVPVDSHGLQYPHRVRVEGAPDYLGRAIVPRR